jgi:hypothetical protein
VAFPVIMFTEKSQELDKVPFGRLDYFTVRAFNQSSVKSDKENLFLSLSDLGSLRRIDKHNKSLRLLSLPLPAIITVNDDATSFKSFQDTYRE